MSLSLIDYFDKGVERGADRPCLIFADAVLSFGAAQASSYRIADALLRAGFGAGTKVAVLGPNSARSFECVLGTLRAGGTWVPVNARNAVDETVYVLDHTDVAVLFYAAQHAGQVAELQARCPRLALAICTDGPGAPGFDDWIAGASDAPFAVPIDPDALATLACSGGTTGLPKGVMTSHRTWGYRIAEVMSRLAHPAPVGLVAAPMTHAAGAGALELMAMGAAHVVHPGFDPAAILAAIPRHRVTHMFLPPTALYRLMAEPGIEQADLSSLAFMICGGAPIAPDRLRQASRLFGDALHTGYGGTEFGGGICWMPGRDIAAAIAAGDERRLLSCGKASPLSRVTIVGDDGRELPPGVTGDIVVDGYVLASGYHKNPDETAAAFRADGFHTGDIGAKDADGWVFVTDRRKDMIITGGFNVYPSEVETVLMTHPAVQDCAVVGLPDDYWGEAVAAVIEPRRGATVAAEELEPLCRAHLAGFKVPKSFAFWDDLPRSPVGKVLKRAIRARLQEQG